MFVFSIGVATFKSRLDGSAGEEVELGLAGGRPEGQEVAAWLFARCCSDQVFDGGMNQQLEEAES